MKKFLPLLHHKRAWSFKRGFFLFECLVAILLLSCLLFCSSTVQDSSVVRAELDRLYTVFLYLQRRAVLEKKEHYLIFNPDHHSYRADRSHHLTQGVLFGTKKESRGPPSNPVSLLKEPITWPNSQVTFFPDGTIAAGAVYLTDTRGTCLYALTCDAAASTYIRRYRWDGTWRTVD